jgi:hypothetical protein
MHTGRLLLQFADDRPRAVGRTVADENHLIAIVMFIHHTLYPFEELANRLFLIIKRYYN